MSLKTDYLDGATGLTQVLADVAQAGRQWVIDNNANISGQLQSNAAKGAVKFTINLPVTFEPGNLRLLGLHWKSFRAGVLEQMSSEDIYDYEVDPQLNTSDTVSTSIDLKFDFTRQ